MADELKIPLDPFTDTGLTLLGKVYNSTGAQEGSTVSMSEDGPALYIGDFDVTTRNDGQYVVRFETNTPDKLYGTGSLYIRDGKEVSPEMYFNQALDTVANVTTVATTTTNTDMRGTDNALLAASYTAPDNAGITNNGNAIGALNDFNPATDTVANVTLVATTTTNTDMRGTDGANTVTPDNAGITANGNAIAALNNFNPASDQVIVATNNDKTGYSISGTKNTLDDLNDVSASDVYAEFTTGSNEDVFKADVSNLDVAVSTRNSVAPDNAGITANGNAIAALNNFNPASDQVIVATNNDKTNYSLTTADKDDIVDRNWDESFSQHTAAGSFGKLMDLLRKANRAIEGEVTGTPTTTSFTSNITGYVTGAFDSEVLVFVSGTIDGEARPILDYDSINGTFNFEEAWTQAPSSSDEFVILPYHVHAISEIQEGLATRNNQNTINENVKKSSKLIPASGNLPDS